MSSATTATKPRSRLSRTESRARIVDAAGELVRERSYGQLTVAEVMDRAGLERTIFYRHFENVGELLLGAGRDAIEELYAAQVSLASGRGEPGPNTIREAIEVPVRIFAKHGPMLRAAFEAIASRELVAPREDEFRRDFDQLVAEAVRAAVAAGGARVSDPEETARALNTLNERYLLDTFGRGPRASVETATRTLSEIWEAVLGLPSGETIAPAAGS